MDKKQFDPAKLGDLVRRAREASSWTLREAETKTGVGATTISLIEREIGDPRLSTFVRLCDGFGIDPAEAFG
jgi:transcriptional regulator with XRE-family HTH domain